MDESKIPHALVAFVDRQSQVPREVLIVATSLPEQSPAGLEADARYEMLNAIAAEVAERGLHGYEIWWSEQANAPRS